MLIYIQLLIILANIMLPAPYPEMAKETAKKMLHFLIQSYDIRFAFIFSNRMPQTNLTTNYGVLRLLQRL